MSKRICIVTGTRAEWGLLRGLAGRIAKSPKFDLELFATGMHMSPEYGLTYAEIEADGFAIDEKLEILVSADTPTGVSKSMGLALIGFAEAYSRSKPDLVLVLGDRFEIFSAVAAAMVAGIPVAHLHGGETTEGAIDEAIRHSISKMSHLHFVAAEEYRRRVIQLGEDPSHVFLVGGLGVDVIEELPLLEKEALEESIDFKMGARSLLVTFHPETLDSSGSLYQVNEMLAALSCLNETSLIFTMPNADSGSKEIATAIERFVADHPNSRVYTSLGQLRYLSCMKFVDGVVGNSSSGLTEAPSLGVATINIGDRQHGRLTAESVINCQPDREQITAAIKTIYSEAFQSMLPNVTNPYGDGGAARRIVSILEKQSFENILRKSFFDSQAPSEELSKDV